MEPTRMYEGVSRVYGASTTGARGRNEDHCGGVTFGKYRFIALGDGHNGQEAAICVIDAFVGNMQAFLHRAGGEFSFCDALRTQYDLALEHWDRHYPTSKSGTTVSAVLIDLATGEGATLNVGDSMILVVKEKEGCMSDGPLSSNSREVVSSTNVHDFSSDFELERYNNAFSVHGLRVERVRRRDAHPSEERYLAKLVTGPVENSVTRCELPCEPSRTVEAACGVSAIGQTLMQLQREPEMQQFRLLPGETYHVFACCDGFVSKKAIPTMDRLASLLCAPLQYMRSAAFFTQGTVFEQWRQSKPTWWSPFPTHKRTAYDVSKEAGLSDFEVQAARVRHIAPDEGWRKAVDKATHVVRCMHHCSSDEHDVTMRNRPLDAVQTSVEIPVLLGGDDNVSVVSCTVTMPGASVSCIVPA